MTSGPSKQKIKLLPLDWNPQRAEGKKLSSLAAMQNTGVTA